MNCYKNLKNMSQYPDFEHDPHSRSAIGVNKVGYDSIRLMKWMAYYKIITILIYWHLFYLV